MAENAIAIGNVPLVASGATTGNQVPGNVASSSGWDFYFCRKDFGFYVTTTGAPSSFSVQPQGSLDGTNWYSLGSAITSAGYSTVTNSPSRFVRATISLTGGTNPTATVEVGAV